MIVAKPAPPCQLALVLVEEEHNDEEAEQQRGHPRGHQRKAHLPADPTGGPLLAAQRLFAQKASFARSREARDRSRRGLVGADGFVASSALETSGFRKRQQNFAVGRHGCRLAQRDNTRRDNYGAVISFDFSGK